MIENRRTVFMLLTNSFLAEHFGHSLPLFLSVHLLLSSLDFRLLISVAVLPDSPFCDNTAKQENRKSWWRDKRREKARGKKKKKNGGKMITRDQSWAGWEAAIRYRNARNSRRKYREKRLFCRGSYDPWREKMERRERGFPEIRATLVVACMPAVAWSRAVIEIPKNSFGSWRDPRRTERVRVVYIYTNDSTVRALNDVASRCVPRFEMTVGLEFREN